MSTTPASLDQAYSSLDLAYSHQLSDADFANLKLAKGVRLLAVHPGSHGPLGTTCAPAQLSPWPSTRRSTACSWTAR